MCREKLIVEAEAYIHGSGVLRCKRTLNRCIDWLGFEQAYISRVSIWRDRIQDQSVGNYSVGSGCLFRMGFVRA